MNCNHYRFLCQSFVMNVLKLLPVILSFLLLGAHFFRAGHLALTVLSLSILLLLFVRKSWVPRLIQAALVLAALEWLRSLLMLVYLRIEWGEPWQRLAVILGGVVLFTLLSSLVFRAKSLKSHYSG